MKHPISAALLGLTLLSAPAFADSFTTLADRADDSARVLQEYSDLRFERHIPRNLLDAAKCIVVIPHIRKVAFIFSATHGAGSSG